MKKIYPIFLLFLPWASFAQSNLNAGLVAYYRFDGNAADSSGNGNHANYNGATPTADRFGNPNKAYAFNSSLSSYIRIPDATSLNPGNTISITAWVRLDQFMNSNGITSAVMMKGSTHMNYGHYGLMAGNTGMDSTTAFFYGRNSLGGAYGAPYIQKNTWCFLTYTDDGTYTKMYMNGQLKYSFTKNPLTTYYSIPEDIYLGRMNNSQYPYKFTGAIDELRIYNRALTGTEIEDLFTATTLPVALASFSGRKQQADILLNWESTNEINHAYYEVERKLSNTSDNFISIGKVVPNADKKYTFTDVNAASNFSKYPAILYRLKMVSNEGMVSYSSVVSVALDKINGINITKVYPNPFTNKLEIAISSQEKQQAVVSLFDMNGKRLHSQNTALQNGYNIITINNLESLPKGSYTLHIQTDTDTLNKVIVK